MNGKVSNPAQLAYIRRYTLTEGREAGLKIIEVNNGVLRFLLNESKALDISQLWHNGVNISFLSKNGLTSREIPFVRRFEGGMLYTCGLDSVGGREGFELHGTLHNMPAKVIATVCNEEEISVTAEIEDTELFGKNLLLRRTVKTSLGADNVWVEDTLVNRGYRDEEYCLLYHVNLGYPMLDERVTIKADEERITPRTAWAKERINDRNTFTAEVPNEEERCYFIRHKTPCITVTNEKIGKIFTLSYSQETLPCFVQWCSSASGDYALGLEPSTTFLDKEFKTLIIKKEKEVKFKINLKIEKV